MAKRSAALGTFAFPVPSLSEEHIPFFLTTEHTEHTEINPLPLCHLSVGSVIQMVTVLFILKPDRLEAILYPTSHLIKGSVRFDDRFETAHPSPNRS